MEASFQYIHEEIFFFSTSLNKLVISLCPYHLQLSNLPSKSITLTPIFPEAQQLLSIVFCSMATTSLLSSFQLAFMNGPQYGHQSDNSEKGSNTGRRKLWRPPFTSPIPRLPCHFKILSNPLTQEWRLHFQDKSNTRCLLKSCQSHHLKDILSPFLTPDHDNGLHIWIKLIYLKEFQLLQ